MLLPPVLIPPLVDRSLGIPPANIPPNPDPPAMPGGAGAGVGGAEPTFPALLALALFPTTGGGLRPAFGTGGAPPTADGAAFTVPMSKPAVTTTMSCTYDGRTAIACLGLAQCFALLYLRQQRSSVWLG
jgi:hypothetical protein